jgi:hypothetical protein
MAELSNERGRFYGPKRGKTGPKLSFRDAPLGAGPESITPNRGYGFRARASRARNDDQVATARTAFGSAACLWLSNSLAIVVFSTCSSRVSALAISAASVTR